MNALPLDSVALTRSLGRASECRVSAPLHPPAGVPDWAWNKIARPDRGRWAIAERVAIGEVIGTSLRDATGGKNFVPGGRRGLILPWPLDPYAGMRTDDPVFVCEGASDAGSLLGLGFDAVGVPMAGHCAELLAELLAGRHVVITADADDAGRRGAAKIAAALLGRCLSVRIIEPPDGAKDARAAVIAGADRAAFLKLASHAAPANAAPVPIDGAPVVVRLTEVKPERVQWLWPDRFALGKLTLIAGDPGLGKSFLTLDMAARVSTGSGWPDRLGERFDPGGVVLLSAEDGVADTIVPRLLAAGANLNRIVVLESVQSVVKGRASARTFDLGCDLPALEATIRAVDGCRLVVIDPVTAYLGDAAQHSHNNGAVRGLLAPLAALAAKYGVAVVAVTHLNKSGAGAAIYRAMGSLAFIAAARAAWSVSRDKDDPHRRLMLAMKNNNAPDKGGLAYRIEPLGVDGGYALAWDAGPVNMSADDALATDPDDGDQRTERDDAADWLRDFLASGSRLAREVLTEAKAAGLAERTIKRAKAALSIVARKEAFSGGWVWALPAADDDDPDAEGCHTPHVGTLGPRPLESPGNHPKDATAPDVAPFAGDGGTPGADGGGWGEDGS